jgi:hypothetical protein
MEHKVLATHTDRFSLYRKVRKGKQNNRNYMLEAVKSMIEHPETIEGLRLGELYGYYGHSRRQLAGKMELPETAVVMVEGKPVVLDNIPACRTTAISVDADGVVTHTQEILDTPTGRIVAGMLESRAGGWSWVTTGRDSQQISIPKNLYGFDYVLNPNFISKDHPAAMFESNDDRNTAMTESMTGQGFGDESVTAIIEHADKLAQHEAMFESAMRLEELEEAMLEATGQLLAQEAQLAEQAVANAALQEEKAMFESATDARAAKMAIVLDKLPVFTNTAQRAALASMQTDDDVAIVSALFESVARLEVATLPLDVIVESAAKQPSKPSKPSMQSFVSFQDEAPRFGA